MNELMWSEPQIKEIEIKMTELNKSGYSTDAYSSAVPGLVGDIVPNHPCS
ncbi:MAG: hypothetical protein XE00_0004 [Desulfofundulus kuznetsovii]|nr:MAG: hypothetical protein XD84_0621 [Desulfotomaculum sp. 46_80]KUK85292.1 MAG: hypothetical protein XE00_0004 [Desulfofundulus kuznetsovii]